MTTTQNLDTLKKCISAANCLCFLGVGVSLALAGPTLPTLAANLNATVSDLAYIIPVRSTGYLTGSIIGGILFEKMNSFVFLAISMAICSIGLFIVPFAPSVIGLAGILSAGGLSMGLLDTGGNVLILQLWGDSSGPYLQALHFFFAIGATLAPIVANPFIIDFNETNTTETFNINVTTTAGTLHIDMNNNTSSSSSGQSAFPEVAWAYIIGGIYCMMISMVFVFFAIFFRSLINISEQKDTIKNEGLQFRMQMITMLFIFFLLYVGMEVTFGVYIFTFASSYLGYSKEAASALNAVFWGGFCVGRFLAIFAARLLSTTSLIRLDLIGGLLFSIALFCTVYLHWISEMVWIATAGFGAFIASIFPCGVAWGEQYITINGRMASALVVGGALGEMILPLIVGMNIETDPLSFMYMVIGCSTAAFLLYIVMQCLASKRGKRNKRDNEVYNKRDILLAELTS